MRAFQFPINRHYPGNVPGSPRLEAGHFVFQIGKNVNFSEKSTEQSVNSNIILCIFASRE